MKFILSLMKDYISWFDDYLVGSPLLDKQHKQLINTINLLGTAIRTGKSKLVMARILQTMAEYSVFHFAAEEEVLAEMKFPKDWEKAHLREHNNYIKKLTAFQSDFDQGKEGLDQEIISYLSQWWNRHILETDMKYKPFLQ